MDRWIESDEEHSLADSLHHDAGSSLQYYVPTTLVYQSPTGLFLENIAIRPSSKLLLTSTASPTLHTLNLSSVNATLDEVYTLPNATGLTGIIEYQPDVYAVVASVLNITTLSPSGASISARRPPLRLALRASRKAPSSISGVPQSTLINGLSTIPGYRDFALAADLDLGAANEIAMGTDAVRMTIENAAMAPDAPVPAIGINDLHVHGGALYFANSQKGTFARVSIAVKSRGTR
ncbi:hypothetical protein C8R44DRAFT_638338 [Mycena epipterygia]|nr:hypothetical protein C8R44DRAFT_638338 [Mycena epipterygia]